MMIELQTDPATVLKDNCLAFRIQNGDSESHTVYTDGVSSVTFPDSDLGCQVTGVATGVVHGLGLLDLVGFVGLKNIEAVTRDIHPFIRLYSGEVQ